MTLKRAGLALALVAAALTVAACASEDHTWRGEFTARLEGASAAIEETLTKLGPAATKTEEFQSYESLGQKLSYKGELIEGLDAPQGCADVEIKGLDHVKSAGHDASEDHGPDYPARLLRADRLSLESEVHVLARVEREAESCATG